MFAGLVNPAFTSVSTEEKTLISAELVTIEKITKNASVITITFAEKPTDIIASNIHFYLIILYGNATYWVETLLFSMDTAGNTSIQYSIGDPFLDPIVWIPADPGKIQWMTNDFTHHFRTHNDNWHALNEQYEVFAVAENISLKKFQNAFSNTLQQYFVAKNPQPATSNTPIKTSLTARTTATVVFGFSSAPFLVGIGILYILRARQSQY